MQSAWWAIRPTEFLRHCEKHYGSTFTVRLSQGGHWVFISDPADVRALFTRDPSALVAGATHELLEPLFGSRSVHLIDGDEHLRQRRMLLPPLHGMHLERYAKLIVEVTEYELDKWPVGEEFAVLPRLQRITLEVIMRGIFGFEHEGEGRRVRREMDKMLRLSMDDFRVVAAAVLNAQAFRFAARSRLFAFRRTMDSLEDALLSEVRRRRQDPHSVSRNDMLSMVVGAKDERGQPLDDAELKDNLVTLVVAGHETTATALSWALHSLARCPPALARLAAQPDEAAHIDAIVRETLRLHPAVPLSMRRLVKPLELQGIMLPKGTNVAVCIYLLHRLADVYDKPNEFQPERFLAGRPDSYAWAPFGGGTRRCLGASLATLEMTLVLRTILMRRSLAPSQRRDERVASLALRPARGGRITLNQRREC